MDPQKTVLDIENRAWEARVSIRFLCQSAGVHPSTFWRWKKTKSNPEPVVPNLATVARLYGALDALSAQHRRGKRRAEVAA